MWASVKRKQHMRGLIDNWKKIILHQLMLKVSQMCFFLSSLNPFLFSPRLKAIYSQHIHNHSSVCFIVPSPHKAQENALLHNLYIAIFKALLHYDSIYFHLQVT